MEGFSNLRYCILSGTEILVLEFFYSSPGILKYSHNGDPLLVMYRRIQI